MWVQGGVSLFANKMAEPNAKEMAAPVEEVGDTVWDPLLASDWDHQKPSSEAIVRMKRYNSEIPHKLHLSIHRDLHTIFSDPLPGIFIIPHKDDVTRVS